MHWPAVDADHDLAETPKTTTAFIAKLYELTHEYVSETGDECFAWNVDGTHFWVSNVEIFSRDVLPCYFKHNNYASFVRQLNMYGLGADRET